MKILSKIILVLLVSSSVSFAQPFTVRENPWFGLPGESEFVVEDNSTLVLTGSNLVTFERVRIYAAHGFKWETRITPVGRQLMPAIWNPLLLQKQISNITLLLQNPALPHRDLYLQRKAYLETILSIVESEIAHSPRLSR